MINEFYCDQCKSYSLVNIQQDIDGLHIISCGKCKHHHYRIIKDGIISEFRYDGKALDNLKINKLYYEGTPMLKQMEINSITSGSWLQTMEAVL